MHLPIVCTALLGLCVGATEIVYRLEQRDPASFSQPQASQRLPRAAAKLDKSILDHWSIRDMSPPYEKDRYILHARHEHLYTRDASFVDPLSRRQLCQRTPMGQCLSRSGYRESSSQPDTPRWGQNQFMGSSNTAKNPATATNTANSQVASGMDSLASASIATAPVLRWRWKPSPPAPPPSRAASAVSIASLADWRAPARLSSGSQSDATTHDDSPRRLGISAQPLIQPGSEASTNPPSRPSVRGILRTSGNYPSYPPISAFGTSRVSPGAISHSGSLGRLSRAGSPSLYGAPSSRASSGYGSGHESADSERDTDSVIYVGGGSTRTSKNKLVRIKALSGYVGIFFAGHGFITGTNIFPGDPENAIREGAAQARATGPLSRIEAFTPDEASQRIVTQQMEEEFPGIQPVVYIYPTQSSGYHIFEAWPGKPGSPPLVTSRFVLFAT